MVSRGGTPDEETSQGKEGELKKAQNKYRSVFERENLMEQIFVAVVVGFAFAIVGIFLYGYHYDVYHTTVHYGLKWFIVSFLFYFSRKTIR